MNNQQKQQVQPKDNFHAWILQQIANIGDFLCVETNPLTYIELQGKLDVLQATLLQYLNYAYGEKNAQIPSKEIVC